MSIGLAIAVYFTMWWIVLFTVLPLNIKTQQEAKDIVPGTAESAPRTPQILKKMLITTGLTTILFTVFALNYHFGVVTIDDIPFLPRFDSQG